MLFQLVFLKKYKHDCILSFSSHRGKSMAGFRLYLQKTKEYAKSTPQSLADVFYPKVKKCFENSSKIIIVPLSLRLTGGGGHANVLIIKTDIMTAYRFEPHGEGLHGGTDKDDGTINKLFEDMFNNKDLIKAIGKIKYVPPSETCPVISKSVRNGFQSMENKYLNDLSDREQRRLKAFESGGFCQAWSFFLIELYMMHPESTIEEIYIIAHDELENDPQSFRELIRGFITDVNKELTKFSNFNMGRKNKDLEIKIVEYYDKEIEKLIEEQKIMAKEKHNKLKDKLKSKNITDDEFNEIYDEIEQKEAGNLYNKNFIKFVDFIKKNKEMNNLIESYNYQFDSGEGEDEDDHHDRLDKYNRLIYDKFNKLIKNYHEKKYSFDEFIDEVLSSNSPINGIGKPISKNESKRHHDRGQIKEDIAKAVIKYMEKNNLHHKKLEELKELIN
jgi:hypothetical protein